MPLPLPSSQQPERAESAQPGLPAPSGAASPPPSPAAAACYRHPKRTTGRRCTRCQRPACDDCLQQAPIGSQCTECLRNARPDAAARARRWQASKRALVTQILIGINVAVFVGLGLRYDIGGMLAGRVTDAHVLFGLAGAFVDGTPVAFPLADGTIAVSQGTDYYRLVTSAFLHFGVMHLALNMWFLYALGNLMEPQMGRVRFASLYVASLLGGSAGVVLVDQSAITAGASGAVFGLLGAFAVGMWRHGVNVFSTQIGSLLIINLFLTFAFRGISIGGHLGGLTAGAVCGYFMLAPNYRPVPQWLRSGAPVIVSIAAVYVAVVGAR